MTAQRLFGLPHDEELWTNIADVWETGIEPNGEWEDEPDRSWEIEEWTVHPPRYHLPTVDKTAEWLIEWIGEDVAENGMACEAWHDSYDRVVGPDCVWSLVGRILNDIAQTVTYRMANEKAAVHTLTLDADRQPLVNGEPLYHPRQDTTP